MLDSDYLLVSSFSPSATSAEDLPNVESTSFDGQFADARVGDDSAAPVVVKLADRNKRSTHVIHLRRVLKTVD